MLKRKIEESFIKWRLKSERRPLVVQGARQVGKTTSIRAFGKKEYSFFYEINFIRNPSLLEVFEDDLSPQSIFSRLSLVIPGFHIEPGNTLIFLDEIQECPNARTALKFLSEDKRVDIVASGSLLGVRYKEVRSYPVGAVEYIEMFPLDFEEFLWANGLEEIPDTLRHSFSSCSPVEPFIHKRILDLFRIYIAVGGMPHAVECYIETGNFSSVREIQRSIIRDYELDIVKYAENKDKQKVRACFLSIPQQLEKENIKFQYSIVEKGGTSRKFGDSILWLSAASVACICNNLKTLQLPLKAYEDTDSFRVFLADTGLLVSMYEDGSAEDIIFDRIGARKGPIYENMIAQMLVAAGFPLYYFKPSQKLEIDFVIRFENSVCPVEVKAGENNRSKSLNTILSSEKYGVTKAIRLSTRNVGCENGILSLPLYMTFLLKP